VWGRALITSIREHRTRWRSGRFWRRVSGITALAMIGGLVIPWPIIVQGVFTVRPLLDLAVPAPEGGVLAQVFVGEGERVPPGARLALMRSFAIEQRAVVVSRVVDSLTATEARARARGPAADARRLEAERLVWGAEQAGLERRLASLALRAPVAGVVVTPRLAERVGRWMAAGEEVVRLHEPDSVEVVVSLERAGATLVEPGQAAERGLVQARIRVATAAAGLRAGTTGDAKIVVRQSNVWGAVSWALRKHVRSDLLL
jgi:multidrug resistance efflux pump